MLLSEDVKIWSYLAPGIFNSTVYDHWASQYKKTINHSNILDIDLIIDIGSWIANGMNSGLKYEPIAAINTKERNTRASMRI